MPTFAGSGCAPQAAGVVRTMERRSLIIFLAGLLGSFLCAGTGEKVVSSPLWWSDCASVSPDGHCTRMTVVVSIGVIK